MEKPKAKAPTKGKGGVVPSQVKKAPKAPKKDTRCNQKWKKGNNREKRPLECFIYKGENMASECPLKNQLSALVQEKE